ncbi:flagellar export chaperone FliS [Spongisporangium articulatum]|uniref:Flagellar export chaperone FliS n=1 Tax=Spongisporangium articulatum TaxID=3362603 RepID=A0ABW8AI68_9ACTN
MAYGVAVAYASVTAETASPQRLLTMLYDRLITDLSVAEAAMRTNDHETTGKRLQHAQEILLELWASLDVSVWPAGEQLRALYLWMVNELVSCRLPAQPERLAAVRELVEPLRDTWKQALELQAQTTPTDPTVTGAA